MSTAISILIVDDERAVRQILIRGFEGRDYLITEASDGIDAMRKLKAAEFDFVISDIAMPKMDGIRLLAQVKENFPDTRVIMITGYPDEYIERDLTKAGADYCFTKPFRNGAIFRTVNSLAERMSGP